MLFLFLFVMCSVLRVVCSCWWLLLCVDCYSWLLFVGCRCLSSSVVSCCALLFLVVRCLLFVVCRRWLLVVGCRLLLCVGCVLVALLVFVGVCYFVVWLMYMFVCCGCCSLFVSVRGWWCVVRVVCVCVLLFVACCCLLLFVRGVCLCVVECRLRLLAFCSYFFGVCRFRCSLVVVRCLFC